MKLEEGDRIKIFTKEDEVNFTRVILLEGFGVRREGDYIIVGKKYKNFQSCKEKEEYGKQIRRARKNKGLSVKELADLMGVQEERVYRWEIGQSLPRDWVKLQNILDIRG